MPVLDTQAFVFSSNGRPVARAHTLKESSDLIAALPVNVIEWHLRRHDFSRWIADVFTDGPLAARVRGPSRPAIASESAAELAATIGQTVRARYERIPSFISRRS